MLASFLDWDPKQRLSGAAVQQHPYFDHCDWELDDRGRLPSPMLALLEISGDGERRLRGSVAEDLKSKEIAQRLAASQKKAARNTTESLLMAEMDVEGWEYVSEHALAREYVVSAADVISIV